MPRCDRCSPRERALPRVRQPGSSVASLLSAAPPALTPAFHARLAATLYTTAAGQRCAHDCPGSERIQFHAALKSPCLTHLQARRDTGGVAAPPLDRQQWSPARDARGQPDRFRVLAQRASDPQHTAGMQGGPTASPGTRGSTSRGRAGPPRLRRSSRPPASSPRCRRAGRRVRQLWHPPQPCRPTPSPRRSA